MRKIHLIAALSAVAALLVGCGPNTQFTLPGDFVAMTDEEIAWKDYDWKAVNPDGAVVVLRERDNDQKGSLDFWYKALKKEVVEGKGYDLLDDSEMKTRNMTGRIMTFTTEYGGTPYQYAVAIFVVDDTIVTIETALSDENIEKHGDAVRKIVESAYFD